MAKETEAKIRVHNLVAVHDRLLALGAVDEGRQLERNWVFDNDDGSLERKGVLLRVRGYGGAGGVFTVKQRTGGGAFKTREEVESMVDSVEDLLRQLDMLGYRLAWMYEKRRRTLLWRDCVFALDECPEIGSFVEIEGGEQSIREACRAVGLDPGRHIDDTYLGLWRKHLEARGEPPRHMIFSEHKGQYPHDPS